MSNFTIPSFKLPDLVARIGGRLPQWPHALALVSGLNAAVKMGLLPQDSLDALEGKTFHVAVNDTGGEACFTYRGGWFRPLFKLDGAPDLSFRANLAEESIAELELNSHSAGVSLEVKGHEIITVRFENRQNATRQTSAAGGLA